MVIITAGMIGVGKTTLTGKIAEHLHTKAFFEPVGEIKIQNSTAFYSKFIF